MLKYLIALVLLVSSTHASAQEKLDIGPCFDFPSDRKVSVEGRRKAMAYLQSLSADDNLARAIDIACPQKLVRQAMATKKAAKAFKIDGADADWAAVAAIVKDARDNVEVHDKHKSAAIASPGMDLAEISCVCTDRDLFIRFKTYAKPQIEDTYYSLQLYADGVLTCSVDLTRGQAYVQHYKNDKFVKSDAIPKGKFEISIKDVVEARVARSALPQLPPVFTALGYSFNAKQNRVNYTEIFKIKPAECVAATTPAYLLARYAEKFDLMRAGMVPLALCLTESVIFENADPALRDRIIDDGLAMIAASRATPERLSDLPLEAVLAWSNRMTLWGSLAGLNLDKRGRISAEAYHFMCLDPRILPEVRQHLHEAGIGKQRTPREVAEAIDKWAESKNRYRWKVEVLKEWARTQTPKDYWARIYKEACDDVKAGRDKICTVNGSQIDFTMVMSPNWNWSLYKRNGFYFGPCGDVAVMSMLGCKSLGIPDTCFAWHFGKEDADVHTFAGYYDRNAKAWRSRQRPPEYMKVNGGPVLLWSMPPLTDRLPSFAKRDFGAGLELYISERNPFLKMSLQEMRTRLSDGIAPAEFAELLYAQVEPNK